MQLYNVKEIADTIREVSHGVDKQRFLTRDSDEKLRQSAALGALVRQADSAVEKTLSALHQLPFSSTRFGSWIARVRRKSAYPALVRENLMNHLVNAALLRLEIYLLIIRTDAHNTWYEQSENAPNYRRDVRARTFQFGYTLQRAHTPLSALNAHTIASAMRSWSDELSVPSTDISGWLEAGIAVSRDLRYLANQYHTVWLWKSAFDSHTAGGTSARLVFFIKALFDVAFGVLSGYGLRARRFIASLLLIIVLFGASFDLVDILASCRSWWNFSDLWKYVVASAAYLVSNGPSAPDATTNAACPGTGYAVGAIGVVETGVGYLMMGMFVSLLWSVIQRRSIDTSRLALPERAPTAPATTEINMEENTENVVVNAETSVASAIIVPSADGAQAPQ